MAQTQDLRPACADPMRRLLLCRRSTASTTLPPSGRPLSDILVDLAAGLTRF